MQGSLPIADIAAHVYNILRRSDTDLRQPVRLEKQLLTDIDMDSKLGQSML